VHERSLVKSLIRRIDEELRGRGLHRLAEVRLAIGEFAGVEPRLLSSAFDELAAIQWGTAPRLHCDVVPLTACCRACAGEFTVERFRFECPACGSRQVDVTAGEELQLVSLSAEPISQAMEIPS
jgi:hydrogenase nickel incorporation protein HypA/HybF